VIVPHLDAYTIATLDTDHLKSLNRILSAMLEREPCYVITIHDSFASHPNHCDTIRYWYKELMAELAESEVLSDIMSQLLGTPGKYQKRSTDLGTYIRQSNYALS